jgi:cytoskeletal protein CcmA (bactofilin family)
MALTPHSGSAKESGASNAAAVQIDGNVIGDISGKSVIIGERALVKGNIDAQTVVIRGHVLGNIRATTLRLTRTSAVSGKIMHHSLTIALGARFQGYSQHLKQD